VSRDTEKRADRALQDQIRYYRERASEYEDTAKPAISEERAALRSALRHFAPRGKVVEFACGTGLFTIDLVPFADRITAIDASPEMLELARARIPNPKVRFVQSDVFSWKPDSRYDVAFFSFWLSHVPTTHFEWFWDLVASCLVQNGRVFFMDEGQLTHQREDFEDEAAGVVRRRLQDGSEHRAVKVLWDIEELRARLRDLGWDIECRSTGGFYWGQGRRRTDGP